MKKLFENKELKDSVQLVLELVYFLLFYRKPRNRIKNILIDFSEKDSYVINYRIFYHNSKDDKEGYITFLYQLDYLTLEDIVKEIYLYEQ